MSLLFDSYVLKQNNDNCIVRHDQICIELFSRPRTAQDGWLSEVAFDFLKCLLTFVCPADRACSSQREEEMPQFVCKLGYEMP